MKKGTKVIGSLLLMSVLLVGCGGDKKNSSTDGKEVTGESIYNAQCVSCHGSDFKGMNQDLTNLKDRLTKEQIMEVNKNGGTIMPPNLVTDEENEIVTNWLLEK